MSNPFYHVMSTSWVGRKGQVNYASVTSRRSELLIPDSPVILVVDDDSLFSTPDLLRS